MNQKLTVFVDFPNEESRTYVIELPGIPRAGDTVRLQENEDVMALTVKRVGWHAETLTTVLECEPLS